jgi:hypothetical protein
VLAAGMAVRIGESRSWFGQLVPSRGALNPRRKASAKYPHPNFIREANLFSD